MLEIILHAVAFGISWILKRKQIFIYECFLQCFAIAADVIFLLRDDSYQNELLGVNLCCIVFLFRSLRLLALI